MELASVDTSEDPEEQRRRIEATVACQNLGFVIGIVIGLIRAADDRRSESVLSVRNESEQQDETTEQTEEIEEQPIEEQTM